MKFSLESRTDELIKKAAYIAGCGGINGKMPTDLSSFDLQSIVLRGLSEHKEVHDCFTYKQWGTSPVSACFFMLISPDLIGQAINLNGFIPVCDYPQQQEIENEIGLVGNIRIFSDELIKPTNDIYPCVVVTFDRGQFDLKSLNPFDLYILHATK